MRRARVRPLLGLAILTLLAWPLGASAQKPRAERPTYTINSGTLLMSASSSSRSGWSIRRRRASRSSPSSSRSLPWPLCSIAPRTAP